MTGLTNREKCWFLIGVMSGLILTIILLYGWEYLPKNISVERALFGGIILGGAGVWLLQKIEWE